MISYISLIFYILAFLHIFLYFLWGSKNVEKLFNIFIGMGVIFNIADYILRIVHYKTLPASSLNDVFLLVSISFGITYFILYAKYKKQMIGMFISPFLVILGILLLFFNVPGYVPTYDVVDSIWKYVHLPFVALGTTFLVAAVLASLMYLILEYQLKNKKFGPVFHRFPPLDAIGKINDTSLIVGFYLFTVGATLGFLWLVEDNLTLELSSPKIIFSVLTWILYGALIYLKRNKPLSPHRSAQWTIIGFVLILASYVGVVKVMLG